MANNIIISVRDDFDYSNNKINISGTKIDTGERVDIVCLPSQECTSILTKNNAKKTQVITPLFKLTDIPNVMEKMGWYKAAYLNRKWLAGDSLELSIEHKTKVASTPNKFHLFEPEKFNHEWLKKFPRYTTALEEIQNNIITNATKKLILKYLIRDGAFKDNNYKTKSYFASKSNYKELSSINKIKDFHDLWQIQLHRIDSGIAEKARTFLGNALEIDDLWAAFGSFTIYAGIGDYQIVLQNSGYYTIIIESIICYAVDSYDFIVTSKSDDYLGHWNRNQFDFSYADFVINQIKPKSTASVEGSSIVTHSFGTSGTIDTSKISFPIYNRHYQSYRKKYGKGKDMIVWTQPIILKLDNLRNNFKSFTISKSMIPSSAR